MLWELWLTKTYRADGEQLYVCPLHSEVSSLASAVSTSDWNEQECDACGKQNSTPTQAASWLSTGPTSPTTEMSTTSTGEPFTQLTLFAADTPASRSHSQETELEETTPDTSGPGSQTPFAYFDPDTHSWKTSPDTSASASEKSSLTFPRSGMTRNGIAYQQPPSAPLTAVTAYSSSQHDKTWLTPTAHLVKETGCPSEGRLNTPTLTFDALDGNSGRLNPTFLEWLMGFPISWTDCEDLATP